MTVTYHRDLVQGSEEWHQVRCGVLTASEFKLILTPSLKIADNEKTRSHLFELLAQRAYNYVEPSFQSYDMERGTFEEEQARAKYSEIYAPVEECGFITNDKLGFVLGFSPDGLVGDDGQIEAKSRKQKWQMETLVENVTTQTVPLDFMLQVQSSLFISERSWCDFVSYSGGMPMGVVRAYPEPKVQDAIGNAAIQFEAKLAEKRAIFEALIASDARLVPTERLIQL
jgi:hypothetical protein